MEENGQSDSPGHTHMRAFTVHSFGPIQPAASLVSVWWGLMEREKHRESRERVRARAVQRGVSSQEETTYGSPQAEWDSVCVCVC